MFWLILGVFTALVWEPVSPAGIPCPYKNRISTQDAMTPWKTDLSQEDQDALFWPWEPGSKSEIFVAVNNVTFWTEMDYDKTGMLVYEISMETRGVNQIVINRDDNTTDSLKTVNGNPAWKKDTFDWSKEGGRYFDRLEIQVISAGKELGFRKLFFKGCVPVPWCDWGTWSSCDKTCGNAKRTRIRFCDCNNPNPDRFQCGPGNDARTADCVANPELPPSMGPWATWADCSVSCGPGTKYRSRDCIPDQCPDGSDCDGSLNMTSGCQDVAFQPPRWMVWGEWSECSVTCGEGTKTRNRSCDQTQYCPDGNMCSGDADETGPCEVNEPEPPVWNDWEDWSACSTSCDNGTKTRDRTCDQGQDCPDGTFCKGDEDMTDNCKENDLEPPVWGDWGEWTVCSVSCGEGTRSRTRTCKDDQSCADGSTCTGNPTESESCKDKELEPPVWNDWGEWGDCSVSCDSGTKSRSRTCNQDQSCPNGDFCDGPVDDTDECMDNEPEPPVWNDWGLWGDCSVTCDSGSKSRDRTCNQDQSCPNGDFCDGPVDDTDECMDNEPEPPEWNDWQEWSTCTASCGEGSRTRQRACNKDQACQDGSDCEGESEETETCKENDFVPPEWNAWMEWSSCSASCGSGTKSRSRTCKRDQPCWDGNQCQGDSEETGNCQDNPLEPPVWNDWGLWGDCSVSCDTGSKSRDRTCNQDQTCPNGDFCDGPLEDTDQCIDNEPEPPVWNNWGIWSDCSVSCDTGSKSRDRTCNQDQSCPNGDFCDGPLEDTDQCMDNAPEPPVWNNWGIWSDCSVSCDTGSKSRDRTCNQDQSCPNGDFCDGPLEDTDQCMDNAPEPPVWNNWGIWSDCSVSCDTGSKSRDRTCNQDQSCPNGDFCDGPLEDTDQCMDNAPEPPEWHAWQGWSACSASCGEGSRSRERVCNKDQACQDGSDCEGESDETETCKENDFVPPEWNEWMEWSVCSTSCGNGTQSRSRTCRRTQPCWDGNRCEGDGEETVGCQDNPLEPPIWKPWEQWTDCSTTCGQGMRSRSRRCDQNQQCPNDKFCDGDVNQSETCVDNPLTPPHWGSWNPWAACSVTCGPGERERDRACIQDQCPDGTPCIGNRTDTGDCEVNPKEPPVWREWVPWSSCSVSCSDGMRTRSRGCNQGQQCPDDTFCVGDGDETDTCLDNELEPPVWNQWSPWRPCSATCGLGMTSRDRTCNTQQDCPDGSTCPGDSGETSVCEDYPLEPPVWHDWGRWSDCSVSCGTGVQSRRRECHDKQVCPNGDYCDGDGDETQQCKDNPEVPPAWREWGVWSSCSVTCGEGSRHRNRTCLPDRDCPDGSVCLGEDSETDSCVDNPKEPPVWREWSPWSECSTSCGPGSRSRSRTCNQNQQCPNGEFCEDDGEETEGCEVNPETPPSWTEWFQWTACSGTCGPGTRGRKRECIQDKCPNGDDCGGDANEQGECVVNPLEPSEWNEWTPWSQCSVSCGPGVKYKNRTCDKSQQCFDGSECGGDPGSTEDCQDNPLEPPVWKQWGPWSECSSSCGEGVRSRSRSCSKEQDCYDGTNCDGVDTETETCKDNTLEPPGWRPWKEWSDCSATCGAGVKERTRSCNTGQNCADGSFCEGNMEETDTCLDNPFVPPQWMEWGQWSLCSETCGDGMRSRERVCNKGNNCWDGTECPGDDVDSESCQDNPKLPPNWSDWKPWSDCSVTCGPGSRDRERDCIQDRCPDGTECIGGDSETGECEERPEDPPVWIDWGLWTSCSMSCGTGMRSRKRNCDQSQICPDGNFCDGSDEETESCQDNPEEPPVWREWGLWSECSSSCGTGQRSRSRTCNAGQDCPNGDTCEGDSTETESCQDNPLEQPFWRAWREWTDCSQTCGNGIRSRVRTCDENQACPDGTTCLGDENENDNCMDNPFEPPEWRGWMPWSLCSASCGEGVKSRSRTCNVQQDCPNGDSCDGDLDETMTCQDNTLEPPGWREWGEWTPCSLSCGEGTKTRTRSCNQGQNCADGSACEGDTLERDKCEVNAPQPPQWFEWGPWGDCSTSCGEGMRSRSRSCDKSQDCPNGMECDGLASETGVCGLNPELPPAWGEWTPWSICSETCGTGSRDRSRTCVDDQCPDGSTCPGEDTDVDDCEVNPKVPPVWREWGLWAPCSSSCGEGVTERSRTCNTDDSCWDGEDCDGNDDETDTCRGNSLEPPMWQAWGPWSSCSESCGVGSKSRDRVCNQNQDCPDGSSCGDESEAHDTTSCVVNDLVPPEWSNWEQWTPCSESCGEGVRSRSRTCKDDPDCPNDDDCDGDEDQTETCIENPQVPPVWREWGLWAPCSSSCGEGVTGRSRTCNTDDPCWDGEDCDGNDDETDTCRGTSLEPPMWQAWGPWSSCSESCGVGSKSRDRVCNQNQDCPDGSSCGDESEAHDTTSCVVNDLVPPEWSNWEQWTPCSESCGEGVRSRSRTCNDDPDCPNDDDCDGDEDQTETCVENAPGEPEWKDWGEWGSCSESCGDGVKSRSRSCNQDPTCPNNGDCEGEDEDTDSCIENPPVPPEWSNWGEWSPCSESCGEGVRSRSRTCEKDPDCPNDDDCDGGDEETEKCVENAPGEPEWKDWGEWGSCSESCGDGVKSRSRSCNQDPTCPNNGDCEGEDEDTDSCIENPTEPAEWNEWGQWTACSATCGEGSRTRSRTCDEEQPCPDGSTCEGDDSESEVCLDRPFVPPQWGQWTQWSACDGSCGDMGVMRRTRPCEDDSPCDDGSECQGPDSETANCDLPCCHDVIQEDLNTGLVELVVEGAPIGRLERGGPFVTGGIAIILENIDGFNRLRINFLWTGIDVISISFEIRLAASVTISSVPAGWTDTAPGNPDRPPFVPVTFNAPGGEFNDVETLWLDFVHGTGEIVIRKMVITICKHEDCPEWSQWTECSVTCGQGSMERSRQCPNAPSYESKSCELYPLEPPAWNMWGEWTDCSESCGPGTRTRMRTCNTDQDCPDGSSCIGDNTESEACLENPLVPSEWGFWGRWSECSAICGAGTMTRTRECMNDDDCSDGSDCLGPAEQDDNCQMPCCEDAISATQNSGLVQISIEGGAGGLLENGGPLMGAGSAFLVQTSGATDRMKVVFTSPGISVMAVILEVQFANYVQITSEPAGWNDTSLGDPSGWAQIAFSAPGGLLEDVEVLYFDFGFGSGEVGVKDLKILICQFEDECPQWSDWSPCSVSCGEGISDRSRDCPGSMEYQSESCEEHPIQPPEWSFWSAWSDCTAICGTGTQERSRTCQYPDICREGPDCPGRDRDSRPCEMPCCQDTMTFDDHKDLVNILVSGGGGGSFEGNGPLMGSGGGAIMYSNAGGTDRLEISFTWVGIDIIAIIFKVRYAVDVTITSDPAGWSETQTADPDDWAQMAFGAPGGQLDSVNFLFIDVTYTDRGFVEMKDMKMLICNFNKPKSRSQD